MKIIIAPDSFKGSISSLDAARAIEKGVKSYLPEAETIIIPLADGGEGTIESLVASNGGETVVATVTDPLRHKIESEYGVIASQNIAIIEMAKASGLGLVSELDRNPLLATTFGTGELISHALDAGYRKFILAIGGSATNDGGAGMLQALGIRLLDDNDVDIPLGGKYLHHIVKVDSSGFDPRIAQSQFILATDVQNPFVGPNGASYIYGPQKGATPEMVTELDDNMIHWANVIEKYNGIRVHDLAGAGAAGGLGGAFLAFFPVELRRGIHVVIEHSSLLDHLEDADLVITGEGRIDHQTASGKTVLGIAEIAKKWNVPVIALAGSIGEGIEQLNELGIASIHSIVNGPMSLQEAMMRAPELLEQKAEQLMRLRFSK